MSQLRSFIVLAAVLLFALPVGGGTIIRGPKAAGGTDFTDNTAARADEVNVDFNTMYTEFNGEIETGNIKDLTILNADVNASAGFEYSKFEQTAAAQDADVVDDYSESDAEHITSTAVGTSDVIGTKPLHLQEEISDLRYTIERLAVGTSATDVASGDGTAAAASWIDGPYRPGNLIYNGGFDAIDTLAVGTDGDGWVAVLTPTTIAALALTPADGQGDGQGINVIDTGAALAGLSQTLAGLKADTRYLALAAVKDLVGTCRLDTTGADTTDIAMDSDDGGTFQILGGTFETDSTPADVVVRLLSVAQSDSCLWDHVAVYEINTDPMPRTGGVTVTPDSSASTAAVATGGRAAVPSLSVAVVPPAPNMLITVDAKVAIITNNGVAVWSCDIDENGSSKGITGVGLTANSATRTYSFPLHYVNTAPVAGTTYTYQIFCTRASGTATAAYEGGNYPAEVYVRMEPSG